MSRALLAVPFVVSLAIPASVQAQESETVITLTVSPSFIDFGDFGGRFGAGVIRLSASRDFNRVTGIETSVFAIAPLGGMTAVADCPIAVSCPSFSTPSVLTGALGSFLMYAGESGLRASLGGGAVRAQGGDGLSRRSTVAGVLGLDWIPRSNNRFAPTFAIRLLQFSAPVAGARQLLLPGVGLRF